MSEEKKKKEIKLEYTFNVYHKNIIRQFEANEELVNDPKKLSEKALELITPIQRRDLINITCIILEDGQICDVTPKWMEKAEGNLWYKEGKLID
jgi:hypothetical protein